MRELLPAPFGAVPVGLRRERILASPRFVDGRFENTVPVTPMKPGRALSTFGEYFLSSRVERRPTAPLPVENISANTSLTCG